MCPTGASTASLLGFAALFVPAEMSCAAPQSCSWYSQQEKLPPLTTPLGGLFLVARLGQGQGWL